MNRIRELREEKKITQVRLSIELEVSQETISSYETGKHFPSVANLLKLRDIFGANIDYILGLSDNRYDNILTAQLRNDETILIENYRRLDYLGRERIQAYTEGYLSCMKDRKK